MTVYSDIIDNRRVNLRDEIMGKLSCSDKIKFAVGYLYLSGFYQIADQLEGLDETKLLIGSSLNRNLMEALAECASGEDELKETFEENRFQRPTDKEKVKDNLAACITANVQTLPHTLQRQKEISKLVRLVKSGKVQIKVYTKYPLHAKAYIFKYKNAIAESVRSEGECIIGSSNLTMSGFFHNTELNTYVRGQKNYEELNSWFDALWEEAVPFESALNGVLEKSWALKTVNPYDIYILTLYHMTKAVVEKQASQIWFWENPDYMQRLVQQFKRMKDLYHFQKVAIMQAYHWLNRYKGVFISDVVGLGKTYIGAGLLKQLNRRSLVVSPPGLIPMWEQFIEKFEVDAKVVSRGRLRNGVFNKASELWPYQEREIVLIDESHHFRNENTKCYRELQPFLADKRVILMTATPQNTSAWNIYHQMKLFHQSEENIFPNRYEEPHLRNFFKKVDSGESRLPDLLKHVMIRRTRRHIRKFYSDKDMPIDFPARQLETVTYNINNVYQTLFDEIKTTLKKLSYARYNLWEYVIPGKREKEPYIQLKKVINTLKVFHKINLFKRLESSIGAFRQSIDNMIDIHKKILAIVENKKAIPAGALIQDRLYRYDLEEFWDELDEMIGEYQAEDFDTGRLIHDLRHDIEVFEIVRAYLSRIPKEKDAKYDQLLSVVENLRKKNNQCKVLIFSEYADTVDYLYARLEKIYKDTAKIHGGTDGNETKIMAFAPVANDYEGTKSIDLMVASDVLSEGHNLQDCSALINYDLHWNPVRLIQRAGRVDRIGSKAETIYIKNFLPVDKVEQEINLQKILHRRIEEIHSHVGEDDRILSEDEKINEEAMYAIYNSKQIDRLEDSEEKDFTQDEAEQIIQNLIQENPEYMNLIKKMQLGLRSSKTSIKTAGSYAFFRTGEHAKLLMAKGNGEVTDDFTEIMAEVRCNPDEKEVEVNEKHLEDYFKNLDLLKTHFQTLTSQEAGLRIDPEVRKAKNRLRSFYRVNEHQPTIKDNASKIDKTLNAFFPHHLIGQLKNINKFEQDEKRWFEEIINLYNQEKLSDLMNSELKIGKAPTEFICGEIII